MAPAERRLTEASRTQHDCIRRLYRQSLLPPLLGMGFMKRPSEDFTDAVPGLASHVTWTVVRLRPRDFAYAYKLNGFSKTQRYVRKVSHLTCQWKPFRMPLASQLRLASKAQLLVLPAERSPRRLVANTLCFAYNENNGADDVVVYRCAVHRSLLQLHAA